MKICVACSSGGHLMEILQVREAYQKYEKFFFTFKREYIFDEIQSEKVYFVSDPGRNIFNLIKCIFQTFSVLFKEKPNVVISTGAGVAIPAIFLGKYIFKAKVIFIETFTRIDEPSMSGKMAYKAADYFFVQWKDLLKKYGSRAVYKGAVV